MVLLVLFVIKNRCGVRVSN